MPNGVALLPVFNIPDRALIAYEAIARPPTPDNLIAVVSSALQAVRHTTPAVLLVPMFGDLFDASGVDPSAWPRSTTPTHPTSHGSSPWPQTVATPTPSPTGVADLRAAGFLVAFEARGWATEDHELVAALCPDFLLHVAAPESVCSAGP
jgi:hypothetical protein